MNDFYQIRQQTLGAPANGNFAINIAENTTSCGEIVTKTILSVVVTVHERNNTLAARMSGCTVTRRAKNSVMIMVFVQNRVNAYASQGRLPRLMIGKQIFFTII